MPPVKRWFPVSHDINSDPEVIELTDRFGLAGLKVWLEILSIADRNEGVFGTDWQAIVRSLSIKCNTTQRQVSSMLDLIQSRLWIGCELPAKVLKYEKYHRTRVTNEAPTRPNRTRPNLPDLNKTPKPTPQPAAAKRDGPLAELKKLKRPSDEEAAKNVELLRSMIGHR